MTESFEDVCASYDDCTWIGRNGVEAAISRLQKTHDHEMEQLRRSRFREGYEAGQRSMDAEHYAVALRLKHLPLDEDSHGNLSQIARAVWHSDFGWTKGACEALRDELVRLLGGVHEIESGGAASCACDAGCDCGCEQPQTVTYDVLGNERHKAVCELKKIHTDAGGFVKALANALGVEWQAPRVHQTIAEVRDRLIHLLGGDTEPTSQESPILSNCDTENGCEVTITDELRKFKGHINAGLTPEMVLSLRAEVNYIADHIDERVKHDRESEQLRIEKLVEQRDEARQECDNLLDLLRDAVVDFEYASYSWDYAAIVSENITMETERNRLLKERDELRKKLDKVTKEANRHRWEYCETCEVSKTCDDLRKSLREIAERAGLPQDSNLDEYPDDLVAKATLAAINDAHEYIGALKWQRDRQRKLLDEYDKTHMKLPVDANGESVHVGDIMEYAEGGKPKEVIAVSDTEAFLVDDGPRYSSLCVHHVPVDTAEDIVRDIHLGKVTDSEAKRRIEALHE